VAKCRAAGPADWADPVPPQKQAQFRHEKAKFAAAGLRPVASECARPPRAAQCPVQIEAWAVRVGPDAGEDFTIVEAKVVRVPADERIVIDGTSHIDTDSWSPLIYNFRHYFGLGERLGRTFRAEY
jgi:flavin reductase (DIM6/NTAB) family NADH-FMN oxidoreductase RutF